MASKSRQGSNDNVPTDDDFSLGNFMLTENPTKKVVNRIHKVKKNTAFNQSNLEDETAVSGGSGSAIIEPQPMLLSNNSFEIIQRDLLLNSNAL
ncbi:hypothetical protein ACH5RR_012903 [Cinchona calisaya]|uniref:Uncharacterized protein n=1 Tax=Cinchona calisaya TaxID=153742 RepID=A0ABD3ABR1_9GENT